MQNLRHNMVETEIYPIGLNYREAELQLEKTDVYSKKSFPAEKKESSDICLTPKSPAHSAFLFHHPYVLARLTTDLSLGVLKSIAFW